MSHSVTKPTKWHVRPAKTHIGVFAVRSMGAKDPVFLHANGEDSDQTGRMSRLIWVFAGRIGHVVGFFMLWLKEEWILCINVGFTLYLIIIIMIKCRVKPTFIHKIHPTFPDILKGYQFLEILNLRYHWNSHLNKKKYKQTSNYQQISFALISMMLD